jgi:hypothetical protein
VLRDSDRKCDVHLQTPQFELLRTWDVFPWVVDFGHAQSASAGLNVELLVVGILLYGLIKSRRVICVKKSIHDATKARMQAHTRMRKATIIGEVNVEFI